MHSCPFCGNFSELQVCPECGYRLGADISSVTRGVQSDEEDLLQLDGETLQLGGEDLALGG